MMISLVSFGYQKMGLTDETSELRDLGDARLAIELLRANLEVVEREQGADRTRDVRSTLAQMQLGYAQAVHLAGSAPAAASTRAGRRRGRRRGAGGRRRQPAAGKAAPRKPAAKTPAAKKTAREEAGGQEDRGEEAGGEEAARRRLAGG